MFTQGHGERSLDGSDADGYQLARKELESERYLVEAVNLLEEEAINTAASVLVIAAPKYDFRAEEIAQLKKYVEAGTSLLIMVDAMQDLPVLKQFASEFGLNFEDNILLLRPDDPRAQILARTMQSSQNSISFRR